MLVEFILKGKEESVVFKNKTNSTTSVKQLENYKKDINYRHIYFKLGYINSKERIICQECKYDIIGSLDLYNIIKKYITRDEIIKQYCSYIESTFVKFHEKIEESFKNNNLSELLKFQDAQLYF